MKKITLSVALLLGGIAAKAQTEYIDVSKKNIFGRSEMVVYNDNVDYDDLEYLYIGRKNDNYHYVKYQFAPPYIIVTMSDDKGDTRELCVAHGTNPAECEVVDSHATQYKINAESNLVQVWISKPNVK